MHEYHLPEELIAKVTTRAGKPHPFDVLEPERTALLVIDMQNYFCSPGFYGETPMAREIVPTINRLAKATRAAGALVIWIRNSTNDTRDAWSVYNSGLLTPANRDRRYTEMEEGSEGHRLLDSLDVRPEDRQVVKKRFSPFVDGSSELNAILRGIGIDSLIITGTATNICCETTARDAMMLNYRVVLVSDATATSSDTQHAAALNAVYGTFADVQTTDETLAALARGATTGG